MFLAGRLVTEFLIAWVLLLSSNSLILGFSGLWSIGHLGFFGLGMLLTGLLAVDAGWGMAACICSVTALVGAVSLLLGASSLRLKQDYFLILSIGFGYIVYAANLTITGVNGLSGISRNVLSGSDTGDTVFAAIMLIPAAAFLLWSQIRMRRKGFGPIFEMLKKDAQVAQLFGVSPAFYRCLVFVFGSTAAAYAGAVFTFYSTGTSPERCSLHSAITLFAVAILGGAGRLRGDLIGAAAFVLFPRVVEWVFVDWLRLPFLAPQCAQLIFGLGLVLLLRRRIPAASISLPWLTQSNAGQSA